MRLTEKFTDTVGSGPLNRLGIADVSEVAARVAAAPLREWLIEGLWPAGAYGALGGAEKTGKTWAAQDLAVSVASGSPWLGAFACQTPGPVLLFSGEGGEAATVRRLSAVVSSKGGSLEELSGFLRLSFTIPSLSDREALDELERHLIEQPAKLVILDPHYLAARGAKGSDLYAMGELLYPIQVLCGKADASLVVVPHWNKTGTGTGAERFSGTGLQQWGRVLGSGAVEKRGRDADGGSNVLLRWEFIGGEIADTSFRVRRRVREEVPGDLNSSLIYDVEVTDTGEEDHAEDIKPSWRRILGALREGGPNQSPGQIQNRVANDGHGRPLMTRTVQEALKEMEGTYVDGTEAPSGAARYWTVR